MKIVQVHNRYLSGTGGEDTVVGLERHLLEHHGHVVIPFEASNDGLLSGGVGAKLRMAGRALWSHHAYRMLRDLITREKPDLIHIHNTFAAFSPSVFWAAHHAGMPTVFSLHNFRLTCATSFLYRDQHICDECVGRLLWPALRHRCDYAGSRAAGQLIALTKVLHTMLGTYRRTVDAFITFTPFQREIMCRDGLPNDRIFMKPHFLVDPVSDAVSPEKTRTDQVAFVGLVAETKGVDLLLQAWQRLAHPTANLALIGDGPLREPLQTRYGGLQRVQWLGRCARADTLREIGRSRVLVLPSRWYETFGMVVLEAMALGTPVLVPGHGPFPAMITDGKEGWFFSAGDADALAEKIAEILALPEEGWQRHADAARATYLARFTPETNYARLMTIYQEAIAHRQQR